MNNYAKAYVEVLTILKYVPENDRNKIPNDILKTFIRNSDNNYKFNIDTTIPFEDNLLLSETKAILAVLFRDYWANDFQREQILISENIDKENYEKELNKQFDYSNLFNKQSDDNEHLNLIEYKFKEKWYEKFINFIKNIFNNK